MHPDSLITYLIHRADLSIEKVSYGIYYIHNEVMPVQILVTKYLDEEENIWLTSLTDKITGKQFERVIRERQNLSTRINALLYALALANPEALEEGYRKMGTTFKAVLDEIGFIDRKQAEEEKKQILLKAEEKISQLTLKAEQEKAQLARKAEQAELEKAQLYQKQKEAAADMLRKGTPVLSVLKWTVLQEDEIMRLKEEIEFSSET